MKLPMLSLLLCVAILATASPIFNMTFCNSDGDSTCPSFPATVSCASGLCYSVMDPARVFSITEADVSIFGSKWTEIPTKLVTNMRATCTYASPVSSAVLYGGFDDSSETADAVFFSPDPSSEPFTSVTGTPGPILSIGLIPNDDDDNYGAFFVRRLPDSAEMATESGVHIISPTGQLIETVVFQMITPFIPTSLSFSDTSTWFATVSITERESVIFRTTDRGEIWDIVYAKFSSPSHVKRVSCTAAKCVALCYGGPQAEILFADIEKDMEWSTTVLPTDGATFEATSLAVAPSGLKALATGLYPELSAKERAVIFHVEKDYLGRIFLFNTTSEQASVFTDAQFTSENSGIAVGHAGEAATKHLGVYATLSEADGARTG